MILRASGLVCHRGGRLVLDGVSLDVAGGGAVAVTGRNGVGKSTLLRVIAGLIRPDAGEAVLEPSDPDRSVAEQAHYLGHRDPLKPALTVRENLDFWRAFLGRGGEDGGSEAALERVGLGDLAELPAGYLSAGQRRRLSLARLLAVRRPVWLLDEPASALDAAGQEMLRRVMAGHLGAGGLILAATHGPLGIPAGEFHLGAPAGGP